ncbi:MAG: alkane 1-monooxygenase [Deltaproteobacteria bacterium]|nr:MAG: alkane 1-monooxygenase [Deltaproteobacteria bacterium]
MIRALPFTAVYVIALSLLAGMAIGGWGTLLTPIVVFLGVPLLDLVVGMNTEDTSPEDEHDPWFDVVLFGWVGLQTFVLGVALWFLTTQAPTGLEWFGVTLSAAVMTGGGGINVAHELMHRKTNTHRAAAEWLMTLAGYTHFCVEHVLGHHRNVATPEDPASSRFGESVYTYLPRTIVGGLLSAWSLETARCERRGIAWTSWENRRLRYAVDLVALAAVVGLVFGPLGVAFLWAQGFAAVVLLEIINYVEHYGLEREKLPNGRYERVQPRHSWNTNHRVSNWLLYNLQRHADHHANASRPYYHLRALQEGPQLPFSYPTAILVSLVPPLWRAIMHPQLEAQVQAPLAAK